MARVTNLLYTRMDGRIKSRIEDADNISKEEVCKVLNDKMDKASGVDGICGEIIKDGGEVVVVLCRLA